MTGNGMREKAGAMQRRAAGWTQTLGLRCTHLCMGCALYQCSYCGTPMFHFQVKMHSLLLRFSRNYLKKHWNMPLEFSFTVSILLCYYIKINKTLLLITIVFRTHMCCRSVLVSHTQKDRQILYFIK